ncbi:integrase core domain protein [Penaeus vannamei]|uniref:Integrase core domain protein n=1 Tax=Penaeus vannamei TaxID=6689 RepID=A0A3R7M4Z8_PENVA|nr:integrase core domain protein [Penaeus vannamei]
MLPICSLASLPKWFLQTVGDLLNDQRYATYDELKEAILRHTAPNPLTALSSFLSSDTTDSCTTTVILHHFQCLLTRIGMTFPPDVMHSLFLKRLPADIQQILLVSDAPLVQLALKANAIITAKAHTPTVATVSATTATPAATLESLAALVAVLSEAMQKLSTRERLHSKPRFHTPLPPRREQNAAKTTNTTTSLFTIQYSAPTPVSVNLLAPGREKATTETECACFLSDSHPQPTVPMDLPHRRRPSTYHRRRFLRALRSDGRPSGSCTFKSILREFLALTKPINRAIQPWHEVRHHIVTHSPPCPLSLPSTRPQQMSVTVTTYAHAVITVTSTRSPPLTDTLKLSGCTVFSRIDLVRVYHQIPKRTSPRRPSLHLSACSSSSGCPSFSITPLRPSNALSTMASKNTQIKWTSPTNETFEACKEALASGTLLNHPLPEAPLSIAVDASDTAIGVVLQQRRGKEWQPLAFYSQTLSPHQSRYNTFGREFLAAYSTVRHFQSYAEAKDFHTLTFALHSKTRHQSPREERHLDYISQFTTDNRHIRGSDNEAADALSRTQWITT